MPASPTYLQAVLWVLFSTAIFTVIFAAVKLSGGAVGTFQVLLLRYVGSIPLLLLLARAAGPRNTLRSPRPLLHLLRAICGCFAAAAITWSSANMAIADATAIGMLYGVLTVLFGIVFLGEAVRRGHWGAIALTGFGAVIVLLGQGAFKGQMPLWPALAALLSAVLLALEGVLIRILSLAEPALSLMLYVSVFGVGLMFIPAMATWQPIGIWGALICLALGPLSVLGQYCTIRGYRLAPLSVVGPVDYSWLLFAALLGVFVFGELPGLLAIVGGLTIMAGGVLLSRIPHRP